MSYETRLLILTIVVSALVLLALARLRFPETPPMVTATQPLERLAARATYDDLATSIARLEEAIAPSLVTLRVSGAVAGPAARQLTDVLIRPAGETAEVRHVPALRIGPATGVAALAPGTLISGIVGRADPVGSAGIIGADPVRRLALVRLPEAAARPVRHVALAELRTPTYVVAVEGTRAGVTLRPVFLGRTERFGSVRFSRALLPLGGASVTTGALMFTLQGEFIGCAIVEDGTLAIVGANDVLDTVERLLISAPAPVDPGVSVQPLTAALAGATGVPHGVVVARVFDGGPSDGILAAGDVITEVDGEAVGTPDALLLQLGSRLAAGPVQVTFARNRRVHRATLDADGASVPPEPGDASPTFQEVPGGVRLSSIQRGSPWEAAGLEPGDEIVHLGHIAEPTAAAVRQAMLDTPAGDYLLVVIRRAGEQFVAAIQLQPEHDASRR